MIKCVCSVKNLLANKNDPILKCDCVVEILHALIFRILVIFVTNLKQQHKCLRKTFESTVDQLSLESRAVT